MLEFVDDLVDLGMLFGVVSAVGAAEIEVVRARISGTKKHILEFATRL